MSLAPFATANTQHLMSGQHDPGNILWSGRGDIASVMQVYPCITACNALIPCTTEVHRVAKDGVLLVGPACQVLGLRVLA